MTNSLINPKLFYYHPFTRLPHNPPVIDMKPNGEVVEQKVEPFNIKFKSSLTSEDIVYYYYGNVNIPRQLHNIKRDAGAVKYMVEKNGLDTVLFTIDCVVDDYYDNQTRGDHYPNLFDCERFIQDATDRLGIAKQIARQYGVDEAAFYKHKTA